MGRDYSRMFHRAFDVRQESDYREFVAITIYEAAESVQQAEDFLAGIKALILRTEYEETDKYQ